MTKQAKSDIPLTIWANANCLSPDSWDYHYTENSAVMNCSPSASTHKYVHESIINQQSEEIEKLKKAGTDALDAYQQEVEDRIELQSRFDELVKSLEALEPSYYRDREKDGFYWEDSIKSLVSKAKREENG